MDTLDGVKTVIAVKETGSITAAANRLGISKALVSKYVAAVEKQFSVQLFNRSTRAIVPTDEGLAYYKHGLLLLSQFSNLVDEVSKNNKSLAGTLRVSTSVTFGESLLSKKLPEFIALHPELTLDVQLTNRKIDLYEEGVDLAIRVGHDGGPNIISKKICDLPFTLCAAPSYIERMGIPSSLSCLEEHDCIVDNNLAFKNNWAFKDGDGLETNISVGNKVSISGPQPAHSMALSGVGIAYLPHFLVKDDFSTGNLIEIFPGQVALSFPVYVLLSHKQYIPNKVKVFVDFLVEKFHSN